MRTPHRRHHASAFALAIILGAASFLGACSSMPAHRWVDSEYGFAVQSDFDRHRVEPMLRSSVGEQLGSLCEVFAVEDFDHLTVLVLDRSGPDLGAGRATAVHDPEANEIRLYTRLEGIEGLSLMRPDTDLSLSHELVHACIRRADLTVARWMEEGLCDLLAASTTDGDGRYVLLWADVREAEVRRLRDDGVWLTADELFAVQDSYPEIDELPPLYAQSASLVAHLVHGLPADLDARERVHAVLGLEEVTLRAAFEEWEADLATASPAGRYLERLSADDLVLRLAIADRMQRIYVDATWWTLLETLLTDADPDVRADARAPALFSPADSPENHVRFARWAQSDDTDLRLAGLLGAAQIGGMEASLAFLDTFAAQASETDATQWFMPFTWIVLENRALGTKDQPLPFPDVDEALQDPTYLPAFGRALATRLRASGADAR